MVTRSRLKKKGGRRKDSRLKRTVLEIIGTGRSITIPCDVPVEIKTKGYSIEDVTFRDAKTRFNPETKVIKIKEI